MKARFGRLWAAAWCSVVLCAPASLQAQAPQWAFRVSFTDKAGSPSLANPSAFLTPRALARRTRLGIAVDETDRPVSPLYLDTVRQLTQGALHTTSRWLNTAVFLLTDSSKIGLVAAKPWVTGVQLVSYYNTALHNRPGAAEGSTAATGGAAVPLGTTGSAAYYGAAWGQTNLVHGDVLHDAGYRGEGLLIAVLDEGFAELNTHPGFAALRSSGRLVDSFGFVKRSAGPLPGDSYHGSMVLSTMAGFLPNTYVGTAPNAQYALYVTEESGIEHPIELDNLAAATERADSIGADIVHASLGYNEFDYPVSANFTFSQLDGKTTVAARAANMAVSKGMLFVTTSGNEGNNSWKRLLTPGDADSALTLGSVTSAQTPASSSGYGPNAAGRIKPDVAALGEPAAVFSTGGSIGSFSGTSFAAPQVAGWAACLWQAHPSATPGHIRDVINRSASHYNAPGQQDGYGVPDFSKAHATLGLDEAAAPANTIAVRSNPFDDAIGLRVALRQATLLTAALSDAAGRVVRVESRAFWAGVSDWSFAVPPALPAGLYFLRLDAGGERRTFKLVHP